MAANYPSPNPEQSGDFSVLRAVGEALAMDFTRLNDPDFFHELLFSVGIVLLMFSLIALVMLAAGL